MTVPPAPPAPIEGLRLSTCSKTRSVVVLHSTNVVPPLDFVPNLGLFEPKRGLHPTQLSLLRSFTLNMYVQFVQGRYVTRYKSSLKGNESSMRGKGRRNTCGFEAPLDS